MRVRQEWSSNHQFRTIVFPALAVAVMLFVGMAGCLSVRAQGVNSPARGLQPAGSYALSDIETISTKNGNLMLHIPLVSLPAGRGGSGAGIGLYYNSKIYESYSTGASDHSGNHTIVQQLRQSPEGGWRYGLRYSLTLVNLNEYQYEGGSCYDCPPQGTCTFNNGRYYIYRMQVNFPDGSSHTLRRGGSAEYGGFARIRPDGWQYDCATISHTPVTTAPMVYYSTDGSYLRLVVEHDSDSNWQNNPWTLYLPGGTRVVGGGPTTTQRIYDRNENYVEIRDGTYNNHPSTEVADALGRLLRIEYDADWGKNYVYQRGPNNNEIKWTIEWSGVQVFKTCYAVDNPQGWVEEEGGVNEHIGFVTKITLPAEAGSLTYEFNYNAEPSTGLNGWGELSHIKLPSGAEVSYSYDLDGLDLNNSVVTYRDVLQNYPTRKVLSYDNVHDGSSPAQAQEVWTYKAIRGPYNAYTTFEIESPTGGITREKFSEIAWLPSQYTGQPYRTENPDGTVTERLFAGNVPAGTYPSLTPAVDEPWGTNPVVKAEFFSVRDAGNLSKTAIKEYSYDKNGNTTEVREYDWVPYGSVPRDANNRPQGRPAGAVLKRVTTNGYSNATPASSDSSTNAPNSYHKPGAPRLLRLLQSSELSDGTTTLSRNELFYDNLARGNLTEQRSWDSTKGALARPLAPGTFVSVSSQYDTYGNVTHLTDSKGVQTQFIYEPVNGVPDLYPTKTIKAPGTQVARTSIQQYNYDTGLVTRATDLDNNVSTETTYDGLGRPTLVRAAVGKPEETCTATEYADAERRVVTRSDLESANDGKLVSIQHYDQLGRVRLSRTLESTPTPQDEADEAKGIKVQSRYLTDKNAHLSYQLVSNPYRAAKATEAVGETTMGWTLTTTDSGGHVVRTETFAGAALPSPFGAGAGINIASTGVALTSYNAGAVVVTDQAGKQKRSVSDGLGRLAQIFEAPDDSDYNYLTSYNYDANGNLTQVTQGGQVRTFNYSSLSRLTSATNPESGTTQYWYDANGNLVLKVDPRPRPGNTTLPLCPTPYEGDRVATCYDYDALNRVKSRTYNDGTPDVTYTYDSSGVYSKGRLSSVSNGVSTYSYTAYDALGRVTGSAQSTDGVTYPMPDYQYNRAGALISEKYPSGKVIKTDYDEAGRVAAVRNAATAFYYAGSAATNPGGRIQYTPVGAATAVRLGNGLWEHTVFNSRLQATQIGLGTTPADSGKLRLDYTYGVLVGGVLNAAKNNGNLQSQTITVPGVTTPFVQTFDYDGVNRLKTAEEKSGTVSNWKQAYTYDEFGNRTLAAGTTYPAPLNATNNPSISPLTNQITSAGYTYDEAGNLLCHPGRPCGQSPFTPYFAYDAENRLKSAASGYNNGGTSYTYDGDGRRVMKAKANGQVTVFVYDAAGRVVAEYSNQITQAGTRYLTQDYLGSTRIVTDADGNAHSVNGASGSRQDYLPFGEEINLGVGGRAGGTQGYGQSDGNRKKWSGLERDDEIELDFAQARYYSAVLGRFYSVDPAGPDPQNPQSFNGYRYGFNNPLRYADRNGNYETDVHLWLTYALGMAAGFAPDTALKIAKSDEGIDWNATIPGRATDPLGILNTRAREEYHFTAQEQRDKLWGDFERSGSLSTSLRNLGIFMHAEQDSFSHEGYTAGIGQVPAAFQRGWWPTNPAWPDWTFMRPDFADTMAQISYLKLAKGLEILANKGQIQVKYTPIPFEKLRGYVEKFNRATNRKDKIAAINELLDFVADHQRKEAGVTWSADLHLYDDDERLYSVTVRVIEE